MSYAQQNAANASSGAAGSILDQVLQQPIGNMTPELIQMKMEHESIMAECRVRPRDLEQMLLELEQQLRLVPEFAKSVIYAKPIGTVFRVECACGNRYEVQSQWDKSSHRHKARQEECGRCEKWAPRSTTQTKKKARNLSIRAAEAIAEVYGFNRVHCAVSIVDATHVKVTASFFDYQKLRSWISESIVSKTYTDYNKRTQLHADDRFYGLIVKAEASKTIREAILRSTPASLRLRLFALAEQVAGEALTDGEMEKIVEAFATKGVSLKMLDKYVGRSMREGWTKANRLELLEAWNAINSEEATVAELFGDEQDDSPQQPRHGDTLDSLAEKLKGNREPNGGPVKNGEQKPLLQPEATEPEQPDQGDPMFGSCKTFKDVTAIEEQEISACEDEDSRAMIREMAENARRRIRAGRAK